MKSTSSVSSKGLTTIPKKIRKKLNIQEGDKIIYEKLEHIADKLINDKMEH